MHKGSGPAQRKRKPHNQSSNDQPKKRRIIRNVSEVQSGPGLRDGIVPSKSSKLITELHKLLFCVVA